MVRRIEISDFRNYRSTTLELGPGVLVLFGKNAQGKTNLLEAIHLVSTTRLLRGTRDTEAIREGCDKAVVSATMQSGTVVSIELVRGQRKRGLLNGASLPRAADVIGRLPSVSFSSCDLSIVQREPSERRMFLDSSLSQLYPRYLRDLALYKRALEQRNALLRASQEHAQPAEVFDPWEDALAFHGGALRAQRREFVERIAESASHTQEALCLGEKLEVVYEPIGEEGGLRELLLARRQNDVARGTTSVGPHRDDIAIVVDGRDARYYGSQGQQRSAAFSIKLASLIVATEVLGAPPVLLLDDVFAELDSVRQKNVLAVAFDRADQAIVTCTDVAQVGDLLPESPRWVRVVSGTLEEE